MTAISDALARYGAVGVGLVIGTAAKYGLALGDGKPVTWRAIVIDLLLLGILGAIAVTVSDWAHLNGDAKVLAGAMTAVSGDRLIRILRDKLEERAAARAGRMIDSLVGAACAADAVTIPGGATPATSITVIKSTVKDPRAAGPERLSDGPLPPSRADFDQLLAKVDAADQVPGEATR